MRWDSIQDWKMEKVAWEGVMVVVFPSSRCSSSAKGTFIPVEEPNSTRGNGIVLELLYTSCSLKVGVKAKDTGADMVRAISYALPRTTSLTGFLRRHVI